MAPGLHIAPMKQWGKRALQWGIAACIAGLLIGAGWLAYRWYTHGDQPPLIPLPGIAKADSSIDETPVTKGEVSSYTVPANHPRYFSIPSLGIDNRRVIPVGLTKLNTLDTPKRLDDIAWYEKSATPGSETGVIVLDGHNGGVSRDGVLAQLAGLKVGETIEIESGDGGVFSYKVVTNETMSIQDANTKGMTEMMTQIEPGKQGLSVMTCAGNWVPRDKVFDKRVIVRAVLES